MASRKQTESASTAPTGNRDEMARVIRAAWEAGLLPRKRTCAELFLDQGQFSKIVHGKFVRPSGHAAALFAYAKMQLGSGQAISETERDAAVKRLVQVVLATWDKTEAGAQALCTAIEAMGRLQEVARHRQ